MALQYNKKDQEELNKLKKEQAKIDAQIQKLAEGGEKNAKKILDLFKERA